MTDKPTWSGTVPRHLVELKWFTDSALKNSTETMAATDEWDKVDDAFDRLEQYRVLHPTLAAMRKLVHLVKQEAAFADVHPRVSMASIMFARGPVNRRVMVAWNEDGGYNVYFVDPPLEFSEPTIAHEDAVVRVLREYLDGLGDT